jgi:hypothetical protein
VGGGRQSCYFWSKFPWWERKYETVCCCNATDSSFVAKVRGEILVHFHAVAVKRHSSMKLNLNYWGVHPVARVSSNVNKPLKLNVWPARNNPWCHIKLWACSWLCSSIVSPFSVCPDLACYSNTRVRLMLSSPNACLIIIRVSVVFFPRFAKNLRTLAVVSIAKLHQARYTTLNKKT